MKKKIKKLYFVVVLSDRAKLSVASCAYIPRVDGFLSLQVHLVSEHVWCDDYLVRSLYLKNSQTGETRTVTQFHFLSWPDGNIPTSTKAILEFRRLVDQFLE